MVERRFFEISEAGEDADVESFSSAAKGEIVTNKKNSKKMQDSAMNNRKAEFLVGPLLKPANIVILYSGKIKGDFRLSSSTFLRISAIFLETRGFKAKPFI